MQVTSEFVEFLSRLVRSILDLLDSFIIPGTVNTPLTIIVNLLLLSVIVFFLKAWLGLAIKNTGTGTFSRRKDDD